MHERNEAFHCQTSGHADHMRLADPLHEGAARHFFFHACSQVGAQIGPDINDARIALRQVEHFVDASRPHHCIPSAAYMSVMTSALRLDLWCQSASFSVNAMPLPFTVWQMIAVGR